MDRPPRDPKLPLLTFPLMMRTGLISLIMVSGGYCLYFYETTIDGESIVAARTAVVNVIVIVETAYLMSCRSLNHTAFYVGFFSNPLALVGAVTMLGEQLRFPPAPLDAGAWLRITGRRAAVLWCHRTGKMDVLWPP